MYVVCNAVNWCHSFRLLNIGCSSLLYCCTPILMLIIIAYLVYWLMLVMEYTLTQIIITWFDYTPFTLVWEGCVACYHIIWKLILDNLTLEFHIQWNLYPLSGMCCFPTSIIHYFWSWKIAHMSNASLYQMYCFLKCVFHMSFIHSGFLALTYNILGNIISKKNVA
jgi:hypothetical protein